MKNFLKFVSFSIGVSYESVQRKMARGMAGSATVSVHDRRKHAPRELSSGQQQRVAIARALIGSPQILFADEPTGNLDSRTGAGIINLLQEINRESRQTIIMVTHSSEAAKRTTWYHC